MDTGIVVAFAGNKIPNGWELCDGRMLSRTDPKYKALFDVIGTIHGGDADPNFQLPDYRGRFLRGVDNGSERDPDAARRSAPGQNNSGNSGAEVGSVQDDQFLRHSHTIAGFHLEADGGSGFDGAGMDTNSNRNHPMTHDYGTSSAGGSETRPKNAYVNYIIKL
jgi:microcystin-dependent protein